MGFMFAWLVRGHDKMSENEHWESDWISLAEREAARTTLKQTAQGRAFLETERPQDEGEPEEPDDLLRRSVELLLCGHL